MEQLPINAALSKLFSDVLPQNIVVDVAEFVAAVSSPIRSNLGSGSNELRFWEQKANVELENQITAGSKSQETDFQKEDSGITDGDNDSRQCEVLQFETQELDVFLENAYIFEKDEIPILSEIPEDTLNLTTQYPWDVHESVHTVEDFKSEYPTDQKVYSFEDDGSCQDQMHSYQIPFPMLEANEIALQDLTALSIEDELSSVYDNIDAQLAQNHNLNGKELLLGSKEYGMLDLLSDHCLTKQCIGSDLRSLDIPPEMDLLSMVEMSQIQGNTKYQGTSIGSCFQSVSPVVFQEFQILDLESSLNFEVLFKAQTAKEPETCDWMFNGDMSFNNLIVFHELALVDDTFKSLPVPALSDPAYISSSYVVTGETPTVVKPQPLSASDRIYLDWHVLEKDSICQDYSCQKKMLEDMNPLSIGFDWDSFEDRKFYDLAFSDDAVDITEEKELQEFLSNAIHMLTGHLGDASTRLSDDNFPLTKKGEHKDKRSFVDGLKLEESKEVQALLCNGIHLPRGHLPQLKNRQHIEKKGAERAALLFKSMSEFNDIGFFLNPRKASTRGSSDCAVMAVNKIAPCTKGERSHSICAQVENRNEQKSKALLNSFPCQEEYDMKSKEDSDEVEARSIPPLVISIPFAMEADCIQQSIISFPKTVIVVNTQNLDKEMIVSRRCTYQKILAMEKKGAQIVERDSELPVDIIICPAVCLVWYNCRSIGKKATDLDEDTACLRFCIENSATNVLTMLSIAFSGCILIFEGDTSFLSTVMESSDGLYAAAASLGIDLQLFNSYSSEVTDEIILSCIEHATESIRVAYPSSSCRTFPTSVEIDSGTTVSSSVKEPRQSWQVGVNSYSNTPCSYNNGSSWPIAGCEVPLRVKKGTTVLAFKFPGGIIVGVDSRIVDMLGQPGQYLISSDQETKCFQVSTNYSNITCTMMGVVHLWLDMYQYVKNMVYYDELVLGEPIKVSSAANYAKEFIDRYLKKFPKNKSTFGTLIAGWHEKTGYELYHVSVSGSTPTKNDQEVCTIGSGSLFSSEYLNMFNGCFNMCTRDDAIDLALRALFYASFCDHNTGGTLRVSHVKEGTIEVHTYDSLVVQLHYHGTVVYDEDAFTLLLLYHKRHWAHFGMELKTVWPFGALYTAHRVAEKRDYYLHRLLFMSANDALMAYKAVEALQDSQPNPPLQQFMLLKIKQKNSVPISVLIQKNTRDIIEFMPGANIDPISS